MRKHSFGQFTGIVWDVDTKTEIRVHSKQRTTLVGGEGIEEPQKENKIHHVYYLECERLLGIERLLPETSNFPFLENNSTVTTDRALHTSFRMAFTHSSCPAAHAR